MFTRQHYEFLAKFFNQELLATPTYSPQALQTKEYRIDSSRQVPCNRT